MAEPFFRRIEGLVLPTAIGGHRVLDFCNTFAGWHEAESTDFLRSYAHLALWAKEAGLVDGQSSRALRDLADGAASEQADQVLERSRHLRGAVRAAVLDPSDVAAVAEVSEAAARAAGSAVLQPGSRPRWVIAHGLELPMLATAWAAAEFLTSADLSTVHACPGDGCGWLFLDPRGRRRWCRMEWCGNRSKVRAHAARQRTS